MRLLQWRQRPVCPARSRRLGLVVVTRSGRGWWVARGLPSQWREAGAGVGHMARTVPGDTQV
ncbi:hypothetical protein GCM10022403_006610 [Streptomyces coacervatus]|uniref:Uncharacterized protein n=1 Tax=Streptomyces coacervatus TaxID=647381 RepID=A0ABP7GSW4_9ACTN